TRLRLGPLSPYPTLFRPLPCERALDALLPPPRYRLVELLDGLVVGALGRVVGEDLALRVEGSDLIQFLAEPGGQVRVNAHVPKCRRILALEDVGQTLVDRHFRDHTLLHGVNGPPEGQLSLRVLPTPDHLADRANAVPPVGR